MDVPAPVISAPQVFKKPCRSSISGSLAALESTVTPSAPQAASIRFSVAPTEGNPSTISRPVSFAALQCRVPAGIVDLRPKCPEAGEVQVDGPGT